MRNVFQSSALVAGAFLVTAMGLAQTARAADIELLSDPTRYTMGEFNAPNVGPVDGGEFGVRISNFTGLTPPPMAAGVADNGPNNGQGWSGSSLFQTFCLELNEGVVTHNQHNSDVAVSGPHAVYQYSVDSAAVGGGRFGNGGGGPSDPISSQTAYLYYNFWNGTLAGYTYAFGAGRLLSARDLQLAIWYFEDELNSSDGTPNGLKPNLALLTAGANAFITAANNAVSSGAWSGIANVRVLNLTTVNATGGVVQIQSVLVLVPLPPAAWLGLGLMTAMGAVGLIRRRKQQALV
jgi:hypothetical protein